MLDLKANDPDRYFLSLFLKNEQRRAAITILDMLNWELASLKEKIDTPHMGFIRLQWWRDEIAKIYEEKSVAPHEILQELEKLIREYKPPQEFFTALLDAREADFLEHDDFDIYAYAHATHVPLMQLKATVLNETEDISQLAEAYALLGLLRAIPFYKAHTTLNLPAISPDAVKDICDEAERLLMLDETRNRYFKAHKALAQLYLKQLRSYGYQPEKLKPLPFKELRVWWGSF